MKTTLEIDDQLFREAKVTAASEGLHLRELIERALTRELAYRNREVEAWLREAAAIAQQGGIADAVAAVREQRR
jgi:hypothetical protein